MKIYNYLNSVKYSLCALDEGEYTCNYIYNEEGNIIKMVFDGDIKKEQEFDYDNEGNITKVIETDLNFVTTTEYTYKDSKSGKVISSHQTAKVKKVAENEQPDNK